MIIKKYCFVGPSYIGIMEIDTEGEKHKFTWDGDVEKDVLAAKNYRKYMVDCFSNSYNIKNWMSERVISRNRQDRSLWLTMDGISPLVSDLELFIRNNGISSNDLFWFSDKKDNSYWYDCLQYELL